MNFYEGTKIIFKKGKEKKNSIRLKFRENWSEFFKKEKKKQKHFSQGKGTLHDFLHSLLYCT